MDTYKLQELKFKATDAFREFWSKPRNRGLSVLIGIMLVGIVVLIIVNRSPPTRTVTPQQAAKVQAAVQQFEQKNPTPPPPPESKAEPLSGGRKSLQGGGQ